MTKPGIAALIVCALMLVGPATAAPYSDADDGSWDSAATWNPPSVPGSGDTATIDSHVVTANVNLDAGLTSVDVTTNGTLSLGVNQD